MSHRPTLTLVPNCGARMGKSVPLPAQHRPKMVMQALNPVNGRVGDIPGGEALKPVVLDLPIGTESQAPQANLLVAGRLKKLIGLFEKGHRPILGKVFPVCQGTLSPLLGKAFPMTTKRPLPREVLAKNLKALMKKKDYTGPELAGKAKVDRKTVNNQLNARFDPRPEQVDAVAKVFGLNYWDLLNPHLDVDAATNETLMRLVELYGRATDDGKESILSVAQLAASAQKEPPAPEPGESATPSKRKAATP